MDGLVTTLHPLDDPEAWRQYPAFESPISPAEHEAVQKEIDSIMGITRDGKPILKLVWNGDITFWKELFGKWDPYGRPVGDLIKRPWVLYKTIFEGDRFVRDSFVPRFVLLTRLEPEQYADTWRQTSFAYVPERGRRVQMKPEYPPKDYYLWFRTIAEHRHHCCQITAREDAYRSCYGYYANPRQSLDELRQIRRAMENKERPENHPFDAPDVYAARAREDQTNNYAEQAIKTYLATTSFLLDEAPMTVASMGTVESGGSLAKVQVEAKERLKRGQDALERELRQKGAI